MMSMTPSVTIMDAVRPKLVAATSGGSIDTLKNLLDMADGLPGLGTEVTAATQKLQTLGMQTYDDNMCVYSLHVNAPSV